MSARTDESLGRHCPTCRCRPRFLCPCCGAETDRALCHACEWAQCPQGQDHRLLPWPTSATEVSVFHGARLRELVAMQDANGQACYVCGEPARARYWTGDRMWSVCTRCAENQPPGPRVRMAGLYVETVGYL